MPYFLVIFVWILAVAVVLAVVGVVIFTACKWADARENPAAKFFLRFGITAVVCAIAIFIMKRVGMGGGGGGYIGAFGGAVFFVGNFLVMGLLIAIIWGRGIAGLFARPFENLFMGSGDVAEVGPQYSLIVALRKRGRVPEMFAELERQLEVFPTDYKLQMLAADVAAKDLKQIGKAEAYVRGILAQPCHAASERAYALNRLADWHLELGPDFDGARAALSEVVQSFPGTPAAHVAQQRLAHLTDEGSYRSAHSHENVAMPAESVVSGVGEVAPGLSSEEKALAAVQQLVRRLELAPEDNEARENLALLYAQDFKKPAMALAELEQLIAQESLPEKDAVRWLHLVADMCTRESDDLPMAEEAMRRIIERFPGTVSAQNAGRRLRLLPLEARKNKSSQAVRLGSYETDIGLKGRSARPGGNPDSA